MNTEWPKWKWWVPDLDVDDTFELDIEELRCLVLPTSVGERVIVWPDALTTHQTGQVVDHWLSLHDPEQFRDTAREAITAAIEREEKYGQDCLRFADELRSHAETMRDRVAPPWYYTIDSTIGPSDSSPAVAVHANLGVAVQCKEYILWFEGGVVGIRDRRISETFSTREGRATCVCSDMRLFATAGDAIRWLADTNVEYGHKSLAVAKRGHDFLGRMKDPADRPFPVIAVA